MKKRSLAMLLCLCMALMLMPAAALAAGAASVTVAGTTLSTAGYWLVDNTGAATTLTQTGAGADSYNVYFDGAGALTLKDATIATQRPISDNGSGGDLTITIIDENTVTGTLACHILKSDEGNITISGQSGSSLNIVCQNQSADGIYCLYGNISLNDIPELNITPCADGGGICTAGGSVAIDNSSITINAAANAAGISAEENVAITNGSTVTMAASGAARLKNGIYASGSVTISGSSTVDIAVTGDGIFGGGAISLTSSEVTVDTTDTADGDNAALSSEGAITVSDGETELSSVNAAIMYSKITGSLSVSSTPICEGTAKAAASAAASAAALENTATGDLAAYIFASKPYVSFGITPAPPPPADYDLWVNNERITSTNLNVQCGEGTAVYDPAQNTLTLNNAEITAGCEQDYLYSGIVSYLPDLEIILVVENNSITNTGGEGVSTYQTGAGYKCIRHDLTISGGGKLTIAENKPYYGYGIYCTGDLTLNDVTLDIDSAATGLWTQWRLDITDCDIEIDVNSGFYGMLTGVGGSAPDADKASGEGIITITNSIIDIDSTMSGAAPGAVTDSAILVDGADAVGALVINSGSLKLRSSGNVIQGGVDTDDPADKIPDLFGAITINGGTVDMATSGTDVQAVTIPAANITLGSGVAIVSGALDGASCSISRQYAATVNGSYAGTSGAGNYTPGAAVTNAGTRGNYTFAGWTVNSGGVTLDNAGSRTATFPMPASAVTVTANWTYNGGGYAPPTTYTVPVKSGDNSVNASVTVSNGTAAVTVSESALNELLGSPDASGSVELDAGLGKRIDTVTIPAAVIDKLAEAVNGGAKAIDGLAVLTDTGAVSLDAKALAAASGKAAGSTVSIHVAEIAQTGLTAAQRAALTGEHADDLVVEAAIKSGGVVISSYDGGRITVTLPYTLKAGETAAGVRVWRLANDGTLTLMECRYDEAAKTVGFVTGHLSDFIVGCDALAAWVNPFTDVKQGDWFYADVAYASAAGLMQGTSATTFDPRGTATRGMIVTILYRLEGEPAVTGDCPFDDVEAGKYYEDAVTWAAASKIIEGCGDNRFGPEDPITREQMAAMLYRREQYKGGGFTGAWMFPLSFPDAASVSDYAYEAMCWCAMKGIVGGNDDGTLAPQGSAEHCQAAAILHRLIDNREK